jgi:hypothetical protein
MLQRLRIMDVCERVQSWMMVVFTITVMQFFTMSSSYFMSCSIERGVYKKKGGDLLTHRYVGYNSRTQPQLLSSR